MTKNRYKKIYKGPFTLGDAEKLANDLRNGFAKEIGSKIQIRKRRGGKCVCTAACGAGLGHNTMYDIYLKKQDTQIQTIYCREDAVIKDVEVSIFMENGEVKKLKKDEFIVEGNKVTLKIK